MADTLLTADEQRFFETGELQPSMQPADDTTSFDPIAHAALGTTADPAATTLPDVTPAAQPATPPEPTTAAVDATEILRRSLAEAQQRVGALEQHIQSQQQALQPKAEPAPDPTTDPLGAMMHQLDAVNKRVLELQNNITEQQSSQNNISAFQAFQNQVRGLRDEFVNTHADFPDAYAHLRATREADLRAYNVPEQQIKETLFREEAALAEAAIKQGRNPAEVIYEMSKRHGYAAKTPVAQAKPDVKLQAVAQAQAAARNLPKTPTMEDITIDGLKTASDSDLNKLVMDEKSWGKIVGKDQYPI